MKILHLFPKLLSLYGEYGNLKVLKMTLEAQGHRVEILEYESGEPDWNVDFVYVGSGTEDNLLEAVKRLMPYKAQTAQSVKDTPWLVTGNAPALFGKSIQVREETVPALEIFPYTTRMDVHKRYLGDALAKDEQGNVYVGFVNTANVYTGMDKPWLTLALNPKLGNDKQSASDGYAEGKFLATGLIGPILAKNPHLLCKLCTDLTGREYTPDPASNLCKAYEICRKELENRLSAE